VPVAEIERMLGLHRVLYRGFTVKHFHAQLPKRHQYTLGYGHQAALAARRPGANRHKRSTHRNKRPRWPLIGMMLHQEASTHAWLPDQAGKAGPDEDHG